MKTTIDKAGRVVIPSVLRDRAGMRPGTTLEVTLEDHSLRLEVVTEPARLVKVGRRLVARPSTRSADRMPIDVAALVEEERSRWP